MTTTTTSRERERKERYSYDQYVQRISMKCINMLINLNEEKEEDVVDDKTRRRRSEQCYVCALSVECLSCVCLILIIIIFFFIFHSLRSFQICKFRPLLLYTNCCYRCWNWHSSKSDLVCRFQWLIEATTNLYAHFLCRWIVGAVWLWLLAGWRAGRLPAYFFILMLWFLFSSLFISRAYRTKMETVFVSWWLWIKIKENMNIYTHRTFILKSPQWKWRKDSSCTFKQINTALST